MATQALGQGTGNKAAERVANGECSHAAVGLAHRDKAANPHSGNHSLLLGSGCKVALVVQEQTGVLIRHTGRGDGGPGRGAQPVWAKPIAASKGRILLC